MIVLLSEKDMNAWSWMKSSTRFSLLSTEEIKSSTISAVTAVALQQLVHRKAYTQWSDALETDNNVNVKH